MYYYLILALQAYCIYHAYTNNKETYWYFIIFFIPVLGSILYLILRVFNKEDYSKVQDGVVAVLNPTKKVKELKKKLEFSETFQNKVNLADAYLEMNDYQNAIALYEDAKKSLFSHDAYVTENLMLAYFKLNNYKKVIECYKELQEGKEKIKASSQAQYAIALDKLGQAELAEATFKKLNHNFSNYQERLLFAEFLIGKNKIDAAKSILNEILEDAKHFTKDNKRIYKVTVQKVAQLLKSLKDV